MDILSERTKSGGKRFNIFLVLVGASRAIVRRLIGFFVLTEEDQKKAGIYLGGEGRDA